MDKEKERAFHAAFGRFALTWAELEFGVDLLLDLLVDLTERRTSRECSQHLADKIKSIQNQAKGIPALDEHRHEIDFLLNEISDLSDTRHSYIHGAAVHKREGQVAMTVLMRRHRQPRNREWQGPVTVTTPQIAEVAERVGVLADRVFALGIMLSHKPEVVRKLKGP